MKLAVWKKDPLPYFSPENTAKKIHLPALIYNLMILPLTSEVQGRSSILTPACVRGTNPHSPEQCSVLDKHLEKKAVGKVGPSIERNKFVI